ncbi:MAG TPA: helix-turn-helix domain-containing protein, partial [Oceanobacillus sp.]|nr:helix-turn-helix domain-containing protein [Oceanobacillus sp.]
LAKDILNGYRRPRYNVSLAQVLQTVADHYGMSVEELVGPRRTGPLSQARQVAMYLAREITTTSLPQIGEAFGGRKHSTVIHSWNKIVEDMENDPVLYSIVQDIRTRLMKIRE